MNDKNILGMRKGESIPMERHGEMGTLYRPVIQLNAEEMRFYGSVMQTGLERNLGDDRIDVIFLIEELATSLPEKSRAKTVKRIIAYVDDVHSLGKEPDLIGWSYYDEEFGVLISRSQILQDGWTMSRIQKYLGQPDLLGINPHGGTVQLYSQQRVDKTLKQLVLRGQPF